MKTGREYHRNRCHNHLTHEPPVTILNDDLIDESEPVTMQSSVNSPSVTRESDANPEPEPPDTNASLGLRYSTGVRSGLAYGLCYVKELYCRFGCKLSY